MVRLYAMTERAMLYEWCPRGGDYALSDYAARTLPLLLFTSILRPALIHNTGIYEIVPGFIMGAILAVAVSLLTKEPEAAVTDIFDAATSPEADEL